jgi:peroxiredoxin
VNPFAIKPAVLGEPWVWRDTIAVRRREPVTIRTRFQRFPGKTVLHCHNLTHEDQGMMQAIEIVDDQSGKARELDKKAPSWRAADASGRMLSSDEFRGKYSMLVFHRGMECLHCAEQLATLKHQYETLRRAGANLVAISQYLPDDPETADTLKEFPFPILVDPQLKIFRNYGCVDEEGQPVHGIFLIDRQNRMLLEHKSETAVSDPSNLVLSTLRKMGD